MGPLPLPSGLVFADLYHRDGLERLDALFLERLGRDDPALSARLSDARAKRQDGLEVTDLSELMLALAAPLDAFVAELFVVREHLTPLTRQARDMEALYACKRNFVQRSAVKSIPAEEAATFDENEVRAAVERHLGTGWNQFDFARKVEEWLARPTAFDDALNAALRYAAWAAQTPAGRARHQGDVLFKVHGKVDPMALVECRPVKTAGVAAMAAAGTVTGRDGFGLSDHGADGIEALDQAHYCILCHHQGRDSCAHGLRDRKTGAVQSSPLGVPLPGCPLDQRISEMNEAKRQGLALGALAVAMADNPLLAGTGHRICNDCMKACVYQHQDPVNVPETETRILRDVLELPWGFEIYALLSRWNPLNIARPLPRPDSGRTVLVVGLGPAGIALSHHLMQDGHRVVAIDGLKIEPLAPQLCGIDRDGGRVPFEPIRDWSALCENLDQRVMAGFGGVAEYGITVRWDKNFLKVLRLLLERRSRFRMYGGVRFGGTLSVEQAFDMGFDHIALCAGAGAPTVLDIPNGLARGVRQASDFLMALQLTGAARGDSIANLQVRLPVVVVGGGLTAIDTATEALAYYPRQVEKFAARYRTLVAEHGLDAVRAAFTPEDAAIADEFLAHAAAMKAEREAAAAKGRAPDFSTLLQRWGGATIAYRRALTDSPAYTLNHEEVAKALEQGVRFAERLTPEEVELDEAGAAGALRVKGADGTHAALPARTILIAAGTKPNTVLAEEYPGLFVMDGRYYQAVDEGGTPVTPEKTPKPEAAHVLMHKRPDGRAVSFFGDLHPSFAGNVVRAMASAKRGHPVISRALGARPPAGTWAGIVAALDDGLPARVERVERLTPTIVEVVVRAPLAAKAFRPGQFFRLQNFETDAVRTEDTVLAMEGIALTGAWVDADRGLVALIVLEMGGSSNLCAHLTPGQKVVLMGPTGAPTAIPAGETVVLAGGGLGNAVLFSIGRALRAAGSRVLYFAAYKSAADRYHVADIEAAADTVIWCCDTAPGFTPGRDQDRAFVGNVVEAMTAYAEGRLGAISLPLDQADRLIAIGSDRMMAAVAKARHGVLAPHLRADHVAIGSINSPMQCMMKKICGQCLQRHHAPDDEHDGARVVFTCADQDQALDRVDFSCLNDRLRQNTAQEKLTALWIARELERSRGLR